MHCVTVTYGCTPTKVMVLRALELLVRRCRTMARLGIDPPARYLALNHSPNGARFNKRRFWVAPAGTRTAIEELDCYLADNWLQSSFLPDRTAVL